jgi:hypothetical protein
MSQYRKRYPQKGLRITMLLIDLVFAIWRAKWVLVGISLGMIMTLQRCDKEYKYNLRNNPDPIWRIQYNIHKKMNWSTDFTRWL